MSEYCKNCCVCRNREWYRLYEDYKKLEAENKKLKLDLIEARAHGDYLNNSALSETLKIVSEQCDQLKQTLKEIKEIAEQNQKDYLVNSGVFLLCSKILEKISEVIDETNTDNPV